MERGWDQEKLAAGSSGTRNAEVQKRTHTHTHTKRLHVGNLA